MRKLTNFTLIGVVMVLITMTLAPTQVVTAQFPYLEEFTGQVLPDGWQNNDLGTLGQIWEFNNPGARELTGAGFDTDFAICDSDNYGNGGEQNADLISVAYDCTGIDEVELAYGCSFRSYSGSMGSVSVSVDGTTWTNIVEYTESLGATAPVAEAYDISAIAANQATVYIKFHYEGSWGYWFAVDYVQLKAPELVPEIQVTPAALTETLDPDGTSTQTMTIANNGDVDLDYNVEISYTSGPSDKAIKNMPTSKFNVGDLAQNNHNGPKGVATTKDVLWDNATTINVGTSGIISSMYGGLEPGSQMLNCADDFSIPPGQTWSVEYIYTEGFSSDGLPIDGFGVTIYTNEGGLPGAEVHSEVVVPADINPDTQDLTLAAPVELEAGNYFLSVYGVYNDATIIAEGRWNWFYGDGEVGDLAVLQDLTGLITPTSWLPLVDLGVAAAKSLFFRIEGTATGETNEWLSIDPLSGTVAPAGSADLTAAFDATGMTPGMYYAEVKVTSNDPATPEVLVPVTLEINQPAVVAPPTNFTAVKVDMNAQLNWEAPLTSLDVLNYKVYQDDVLLETLEPTVFEALVENLPMGTFEFGVSAVFAEGESEKAVQSLTFTTAVDLPFVEDWASGDFATNGWTFDPEQGNWVISSTGGNPAPSAELGWQPSVENYDFALVSPVFNGPDADMIAFKCDLFLDDYAGTGAEHMSMEVSDGASWVVLEDIPNAADIAWTQKSYDITAYAANKEFQIRIRAYGATTYDINNWNIDNIKVYEVTNFNFSGTITENASGNPIEGAHIMLNDNAGAIYEVDTDASGQYTIPVEGATYDVVLTKEGYNTIEAMGVLIEDDVVWDQAMTMPVTNATPDSWVEEFEEGSTETATQIFTLSNTGDGPTDWNASIQMVQSKEHNMPVVFSQGYGEAESYEGYTGKPISTSDAEWDLQFNIDAEGPMGTQALAGAETDGVYLYVAEWNNVNFGKFDLDGNLIETFTIPGVSSVRDMAWDGEFMYGSDASNKIWKMDFVNKELVETISIPAAARALAYDSDQDAFYVNNWDEDITLVDRQGNILDVISGVESQYGMAYDNLSAGGPFLWCATGTATGVPLIIKQYDLAAGAYTGVEHNVSADIGEGLAGGLFLEPNLITGTITIGGCTQGSPDAIYGYELGGYSTWLSLDETSGTLAGDASADVTATMNPAGMEQGTYEAKIKFKFTPGEDFESDVTMTILVGEAELDMNGINMYPNPVMDNLYITLTDNVRLIRITNVLGQLVYDSSVEGTDILTIDTKAYEAGTYLVQFVSADGDVSTQRLIVQ